MLAELTKVGSGAQATSEWVLCAGESGECMAAEQGKKCASCEWNSGHTQRRVPLREAKVWIREVSNGMERVAWSLKFDGVEWMRGGTEFEKSSRALDEDVFIAWPWRDTAEIRWLRRDDVELDRGSDGLVMLRRCNADG